MNRKNQFTVIMSNRESGGILASTRLPWVGRFRQRSKSNHF